MARYRKIDPRIWNDEKFRKLSVHGKLMFLFVLTHPHQTALGAFRASKEGLVAEIASEDEALAEGYAEAFREGFAEAARTGMLEVCDKARFVSAPNFLRYNPPESPNVVKAWVDCWDLIPECSLKRKLFQRVKGFAEGYSEAFQKAFREAFAKAMPYQEQEQEQEQEEEKHPSSPQTEKPSSPASKTATPKVDPVDQLPIPPSLDNETFRTAWDKWKRHRREIKKPLKPTSADEQLTAFAGMGANRAIAAINHTVKNGWQGIREPDGDNPLFNNGPRASPPPTESIWTTTARQLDEAETLER